LFNLRTLLVSDAGKDIEKKRQIEGLAQSMIQNGLPTSAVISIFESENFSQIKDKVVQAEKAAQELQQAQQQAEQEMKQQELEMKQQEVERGFIEREKDRQLEIEKALISAEASEKGSNANLEKMMQDFQIKQQQLALKERELDIKANQTNE